MITEQPTTGELRREAAQAIVMARDAERIGRFDLANDFYLAAVEWYVEAGMDREWVTAPPDPPADF